jgi:histidine triad (HIT) family protein
MTIFERIIAGELAASFVHQDELCVAFMDINPITLGHVLVVSRCCVPTLQQLDASTRQHLWEVAHRIGLAQKKALGSGAQHLMINDGKAASQTVPHVHIHVIPRYHGDTLHTLGKILWHVGTLTVPRRETAARRQKLHGVAQRIRAELKS